MENFLDLLNGKLCDSSFLIGMINKEEAEITYT